MDLFNDNNDWSKKLHPLLDKYKDKKHPLNYENLYQLMIAVILSARDSDANINKIAPPFFIKFPDLETLSRFEVNDILPFVNKVTNFNNKAEWIVEIAHTLKKDNNIPTSMEKLILLKGIGRKSANVIMREMKVSSEGIIVDLHVIRVVPRIGLCNETKDGNKIEKQLMYLLAKEIWREIGMSISFLGREICRPTNPKCINCPIEEHCLYPFKTIP